jgi:hypothetical protein
MLLTSTVGNLRSSGGGSGLCVCVHARVNSDADEFRMLP